MGEELFTNQVYATFAASITATTTILTLNSGDGAQFPVIASGTDKVFRIGVTDKDGNWELMSICRREAGSDTLYVGTGTAHQAAGHVAGRGIESTTARAITYTDEHIIELPATAAQLQAAVKYSDEGELTASPAEINSVCDGNTATAAELSELHSAACVSADFTKLHALTASSTTINANMTAVSAATATPTASTIAKFNSAGVMDGAELNMTGETSATSDTSPTTLDLGTVTAGDRIFVSARATLTVGTGTPTAGITVSKSSGTATVVFDHDQTYMAHQLGNYTPSSGLYLHLSGVAKVTVSGTLVLRSSATYTSGAIADNQIYAFFLKKA